MLIEKIILGAAQLGLNYGINNKTGKPNEVEAFKILNLAYQNGIKYIDTAEAYGNSQKIIGQFLKKHSNKTFKVITKLAADSSVKPEKFLAHLEKNCLELNVESLHGYMFHNYQSFKRRIDLTEMFLLAKEKGLIQEMGISLYTNAEVEEIIANQSHFDFIQIPFNLFDNSSKRREVIEKAKSCNINVHTRSVFLQGLFFKNYGELPEKLQQLVPYLEKLSKTREKHHLTVLNLSLQYALQKGFIDHVLVGVETPRQLMTNIRACKKETIIPHDEIDALAIEEVELLNPSNWN